MENDAIAIAKIENNFKFQMLSVQFRAVYLHVGSFHSEYCHVYYTHTIRNLKCVHKNTCLFREIRNKIISMYKFLYNEYRAF